MQGGQAYNGDVVTALIAKKLERRGASAALAHALGVKPASVSRWRQGQSVPEPDKWPAIEKALGYPPGTFATEAGLDDASNAALTRIETLEAEMAALRQLFAEMRQAILKTDESIVGLTEQVAEQAQALAKMAQVRGRRHG